MGQSPLSSAREALVASLRRRLAALQPGRVPELPATKEAAAAPPEPVVSAALSTGCPPLDQLLPQRGWQRGSLVEWLAEQPGSGAGTLAWLSAREAARDGRMVVVLDRQRQFYPPAAAAWGVSCEQLLVLQPADAQDELWALDQALRSPAVAAVWAPLGKLDSRQFRRLQLAAECGGTLGLLVRSSRYRGEPSWADVQLVVEALPTKHTSRAFTARTSRRLRVVIARCRGGTPEQMVELRIEDFSGAIHATPAEGTRHATPHSLPPPAAVAFANGYRRPTGA